MKRVITASRHTSDDIFDTIVNLQADLKSLAQCSTIEDVDAVEWKAWRLSNFIHNEIERNGVSVNDAIQDNIEWLCDQIKKTKQDYRNTLDYEQNAVKLMKEIEAKLRQVQYHILSADDTKIVVQPPENANHRDCITFVDNVVVAIDGKFHGTARGGSWTQWDLLSSGGVRFKAGWEDDNWVVILQ